MWQAPPLMKTLSPPSYSELLYVLRRSKMNNLRLFAKEINVQPARSKKETIRRIMAELKTVIRLITMTVPDDWQKQ